MTKQTTKIAIYGAFGSGKTDQIGHLIKWAGAPSVYICSYERGLGPIASLIEPSNVYEIGDIEDARAARSDLATRLKDKPDAWVCHDGASTALQYLANEDFRNLEEAFDLTYSKKPLPGHLAIYARYLANRDNTSALAMDVQALYGRIGMRSEDWWNGWTARAPWHTYANFVEEKTEHDARTRQRTGPYGPDVPGKMGLRAIVGKFDAVFRVTREADGSTTAWTQPGPLHIAKVRADRWAGVTIPGEIRNFNLADFAAKFSATSAEGSR